MRHSLSSVSGADINPREQSRFQCDMKSLVVDLFCQQVMSTLSASLRYISHLWETRFETGYIMLIQWILIATEAISNDYH